MELYFDFHFFVIVVPFFYIVLPLCLGGGFWFWKKLSLPRSTFVFSLCSLFSILFFWTKPQLDVFDVKSWMYAVGAITQVVIFTMLPLSPIVTHWIIFKKDKYKWYLRMIESYFLFGVVFVFLILRIFLSSPVLLNNFRTDPFLIARVVNIQNLFSFGM